MSERLAAHSGGAQQAQRFVGALGQLGVHAPGSNLPKENFAVDAVIVDDQQTHAAQLADIDGVFARLRRQQQRDGPR